ncbi:MAG: hypothetical protein QOG52_833, partial [Frankiaceae bacterium]|nr:hypothetical protein [Frankiaceae bacterium]
MITMTDLRKIPALFCLVLLAAGCSSTSAASSTGTTPAASSSVSTSETPSTTPSTSDSPTATVDATASFALPTDLLTALPTGLPSLGDGKGCEKLTPADISAAAGFTVKAPQSEAVGPIVVCVFTGPAGDAVLIRLERGVGAVGWTAGKTALDATGQKTTSVSGLGDEAYSAGVAGAFVVGARKGDGDV